MSQEDQGMNRSDERSRTTPMSENKSDPNVPEAINDESSHNKPFEDSTPSKASDSTLHAQPDSFRSKERSGNQAQTSVSVDDEPKQSSIFGDGRLLSPVTKPDPDDSDDDVGDKLASEQVDATPEVTIKQEPVGPPVFSSLKGIGQSEANAIEISDGEDEHFNADSASVPSQGRNTAGRDQNIGSDRMDIDEPPTSEEFFQRSLPASGSIDLGSSSLKRKTDANIQTQAGNDEQSLMRGKMKAAQKAMLNKITNGQMNFSARNTGVQSSQAIASSSQPGHHGNVEDDAGWNIQDESDNDEMVRSFQAYERDYFKKRDAGKTGFKDEIEFIKRQRIFESKQNRIELGKARLAISEQHQASETPEGMFVSEDATNEEDSSQPVTGAKRTRDSLGNSDVDYDTDMDDGNNSSGPSIRKHAPKKAHTAKRASRKGPSKKEQRESMNAGIDGKLAKEEKKKKRRKSSEQTPSEQSKRSGSSSKGNRGRPKGSRNNGPSKSRQAKSGQPKIPMSNKQRIQLMKDFTSFSNSNVYIDANENLSRGGFPDLPQRNKTDALKALIASVPEEDRRSASLDKKQILAASRMLGRNGLCRLDGKGDWYLKGLQGSLKHHQVLGAAFMVERETQTTGEPFGGLCADEMGFGKTIMMIANMIVNKATPGSDCKTTLIVATPGLITQWMNEIAKWVKPDVLPIVVCCLRQNQLFGHGTGPLLEHADVILTTYQMILKSYPKYEPPPELVNPDDKRKWWEEYFNKNKGFFHRTKFYRVVIDEAQFIKNHNCQTSIACRGLIGKHRWAMSGTPIHNSIEELYPYFKFLHVRHTGSLDTFKENFCSKGSEISNARLHGFLRMFMMRRTHKDTLFDKPIIKLPRNHQTTIEVEFNAVERKIYDIVKFRFMKRIEHWYRSGGQETLHKNYNNILVMLMRLRQLTSHVFLAQQTIEELIELDDIEELWAITEKETRPGNPDKALLNRMKQLIISAKDRTKQTVTEQVGDTKGRRKGKDREPATTQTSCSIDEIEEDTAGPSNSTGDQSIVDKLEAEAKAGPEPLIFKFRKFIRAMKKSDAWREVVKRSVCHRCEDTPDEPYVTDCFHIYCHECLLAMMQEVAEQGEDSATCLSCGATFKETKPCTGLNALGYTKHDHEEEIEQESSQGSKRRASRSTSQEMEKSEEESMNWILKEGEILPSTKVTMVALTVAEWLREDPTKKIIIFTQWRLMYGARPGELPEVDTDSLQDQDPRKSLPPEWLGPSISQFYSDV